MNKNDSEMLDIKCVYKSTCFFTATSLISATLLSSSPSIKMAQETSVKVEAAAENLQFGDNEAEDIFNCDNETGDIFSTIEPTVIPTIEPTLTPTVEPTIEPEKPVQKEDANKFLNDFCKEDRFTIYRIVEAEATGQGYNCKKNVAAVVLNRIKSDQFPNTASGVVFQKKQFAPTSDGRYWKVDVTAETKKAVMEAYNEGYTAKGALYFANIADVKNLKTKDWFKNLKYLFKDSSGHTFYK